MRYKIEQVGPPKRAATGRPRKYPFDDMSVGDSFFVPRMKAGHISGSMKLAAMRLGYSFCTRTESVNEVRGIRVYRIK